MHNEIHINLKWIYYMSYDDSFYSDGIWFSPSAIDKGLEKEYDDYINRYNKDGFYQSIIDDDFHKTNDFSLLKAKRKFFNNICLDRTVDKIERKFLDIIFLEQIKTMKYRYSKIENISNELSDIAEREDFLRIILTGCFRKHYHCKLSEKEISKIENFISTTRLASSMTPYQKTGIIQNFIHEFVNNHYGNTEAHLSINSKLMSNILSATKLYFCLISIRNYSIQELLSENNKTDELASEENRSNTDTRVSKNKKIIKNWKVRHMKSFLNYMTPKDKEIFSCYLKVTTEIRERYVNNIISILDYKTALSNIYIQILIEIHKPAYSRGFN